MVRTGSRVCVAGLVLWLALLALAAPSEATLRFARETGKDCDNCHVTPGGPLTAAGEAFRAAGNQLPSTTTGPTSDSGTTEAPATGAPGSGDGGAGGKEGTIALLGLPEWLRSLLLFAHLTAMVTWLGAIIFVHVVQTPRIAGRGIPSGYLKLAWPSIIVLGLSGLLLTFNAVTSIGGLVDTRWGIILLVKILIYLLLTTVASFVTFVVNPRLKRLADTEAGHPLGSHEHLQQEGRITFSHDGKVYDVTESRLWREGRHARRHSAWQDLTTAMADAPHGLEVLDRYPVIAGGAEQPTPRPVRFFIALAYGNLGLVLASLFVVAIW